MLTAVVADVQVSERLQRGEQCLHAERVELELGGERVGGCGLVGERVDDAELRGGDDGARGCDGDEGVVEGVLGGARWTSSPLRA